MKNFLTKINKTRTLGVAAFLISLSFFTSRVLGLVRDRLLASNFGVGAATDTYAAAFRIPDLLFAILVTGAFTVAFIPVFVSYLEKDKVDKAWEVAGTMLNLITLISIVFGVVAFIFASPLVTLIAPGFDAARHETTVNMTRIMIITPLLFGVSSLFGAIQQSFNRFVLFALAGVFYNAGIIFGIVFLGQFFAQPIYGVAWGVVLGTGLQAIMQFMGALGVGFRYSSGLKFWSPDAKRIILLIIPRSLDLAIEQFNMIVITAVGSRLVAGSLTSYYFASNLSNVPIGLFGAAIATAVFPTLIRAAKSSDKAKLPAKIVQYSRMVLFLIIPASLITIVMRGYIVRLLFGFGDQVTADALGWLAGMIVAQSIFFLVARVFYALEDTKTPLFTSIATMVINLILSIVLSRYFGVSGMAMAISISTIFELGILFIMLRFKIGRYGLKSIIIAALKAVVASIFMAITMYALVSRFLPLYAADQGFLQLAPKFAAICAAGLVVYMIAAYFLRIGEEKLVFNIIKKRFNKIMRRA